ncbi:ATP-binding protein, partial [Bernardetia sp.]|uniref:ATP-binding protein n=1 Tax=Bernardetia sp. TaxID=1937974 RepID=UPI0025BF3E86
VKDILGYSINEIVGKSLHSFLLSKENLENLFFILKERKKIKNYEIKVISKLGVTKRLLCNFQTIENQYYQNNKLLRDIVGIEGIAREVNETEKTNKETIKSKKEDIERILESKKQFLADMGHEIRTPMNGIIGMIDLLRTTPLDNEQNNYINTIEGASKNLLSILNNVLDLSKIEANKMLLKPEVFEIEPLLNQLPLLFEKELQKKSISLSISLEKGTSQYIIADKSRLLQIFSNLVSNAIKYNKPRGSVTVSVKTLKEEDKRLLLQGEVRDTGIGIPEENQEFLFDSFSKLQHNYQKTVSGTGLGLTITKQLVEIMGGTIQVWSKENEGSTFSFSFEALKSMGHNVQDNINTTDDNTTQNEINSSDWENSFVGNPSILLVDDNATNLLVAEIILTKAGCKVVTAVNGKEAIQKIKKNQFELVYMDIQMPEMDGVTATRFIKRLKISVPPIIALTAFTVAEEKERFIDAGMDDYLAKPVKAETLVRKTKQWIDSHFYATKSETKSLEKQKPTPKSKSISQTNSVTESLNTLPIVNTQTAQQLQKWGGRELVDESYQLFEEETTGLLIEAIMAFNKGDRKTLKLHVHTIKGSAATLGIDRMASLATEVDTMLKADINADVSDQMQAFEHSFEEYRLNYRIILNL